MNIKITSIGIVSILFFIFTSGCIDSFISGSDDTVYSSHPTKISYTIDYGYFINCTDGTGEFQINYDCDTPELLNGDAEIIEIFNQDYTDKTVASFNNIKSWDITKTTCSNTKLGLSAQIISESNIVADLNGESALTIQEIKNNYPSLVNNYCQAQVNDSTTYIDPENSEIEDLASTILTDDGSDNSFIAAKQIFIWLKENTIYSTHSINNNVQPASVTLQTLRGDCDDLSFLYISLCRAAEIPARFIRGFIVNATNATAHAWAEVFVGGGIGDNGWIPVECAGIATGKNKIQAEINQNFALEDAFHLRLFKDDGSNESLAVSLAGISYSSESTLDIAPPTSFAIISNYNVISSNELKIDENNQRIYQ